MSARTQLLLGATAALLLALGAAGCGRVPQSADCAAFTACVRALDGLKGRATDLVRFDAAGPCWTREEAAALCTQSCERGLALVRRTEPAVPEACRE